MLVRVQLVLESRLFDKPCNPGDAGWKIQIQYQTAILLRLELISSVVLARWATAGAQA